MTPAEEFWLDDAILTDLLFTSNMSISDIAKRLDCSTAEVSKRIKQLGLDWVKRTDRKMSRGAAALTHIVRKLLPGAEVINEYHVGERLLLDIYCPKYKLGLEYHGRQHFVYTSHFHTDYDAFIASQKRDERKIELCREQGITLVTFRYNESLTEEAVFDRILDAIRSTPNYDVVSSVKTKGSSFSAKGNPIYENWKRENKERQRELYKKRKLERQSKGDSYLR